MCCGREVPFAAAEESWVVATDLAEALARNGTAFHQAHQIVGRLVLESVRNGKKPADWNAESLAAFAPEFTPDVARLLDPREGMKTREIAGGTGPGVVAAALGAARRRLAELANDEELPAGPDSETDSDGGISPRRKIWRGR